jgi:hypothetical protein
VERGSGTGHPKQGWIPGKRARGFRLKGWTYLASGLCLNLSSLDDRLAHCAPLFRYVPAESSTLARKSTSPADEYRAAARNAFTDKLANIEEDRVRHLELMVDRVPSAYREMESCVSLD